jgi:hypothetical protein
MRNDMSVKLSTAAATSRWTAMGIALLLTPVPIKGVDPTPPLSQILERVADYVRQFEDDFAVILSDEDYVQTETISSRSTTFQRRIRSETLFTWLPDERTWLTVRTILTVNGAPIPNSKDRLNGALADLGPGRTTRLRRLRDEGARFNIGRIFRNFNDPTLVLQFLDPVDQPRFAFSIVGAEKLNGINTWKVAFEEVARPTIIRNELGGDVPSSGLVWISRSDNAVARPNLTINYAAQNTRIDIVVDYGRNRGLDMWVPIRMEERYHRNAIMNSAPRAMPYRLGTARERIECVATYSDFRRFETSAKVVPPQ